MSSVFETILAVRDDFAGYYNALWIEVELVSSLDVRQSLVPKKKKFAEILI